jgi:hypothetical protein
MRFVQAMAAAVTLASAAGVGSQQPPPPAAQAQAAPIAPYPPPHPWQPQFVPGAYSPPAPYAQVSPLHRRRPVLDYREGDPVPPGYHVETLHKKGLVTAGWIVTAIPYSIGLLAALGADFRNDSGWLAVPVAGPWLTMGRRDYGCDESHEENKEALACAGDVFVVMGLIMGGVAQATGGSLLLAGHLATKQKLVPDVAVTWVGPLRVGTGGGVGLAGHF